MLDIVAGRAFAGEYTLVSNAVIGMSDRHLSGRQLAHIHMFIIKSPHETGLQEGTVTQMYCLDSGLLANDYCPNDARGTRVTSGEFVNGDDPTQYCTLHVPAYICNADPILDEAGEPTGMYHLAGEFCPEESKVSVAILDYTRNKEGVEYVCRDENYLKEHLEALGTCHIHLEAQPPVYDPLDPSTWPNMPGWEPSIPENPDQQPVDPNQPLVPEIPVEPTDPVDPVQPSEEPEV